MNPRVAYLVALLTGAALTLAFPEPSLSFIAWFALAPTLYLTTNSGPGRGAAVWGAFGIGFFSTMLSWVSIAGWLAWAVLLVVQIPFVVAFGAIWGWLSGKTGSAGRIALAAAAWASAEYLRSIVPLGGFTWGQLAQSQHDVPWLLSWTGLAGGVALAGLIAGFNAALAEVGGREKRLRRVVIAAGLAAGLAVGGIFLKVDDPDAEIAGLRVALVQGNVDPAIPQDFEKDFRILQRHVRLTEQIDEPVDLVVWPESAAAIDPDNPVVQPLLQRAATAVDAPMIIGGTEDVGRGHDKYQVMTFLVSPDGEIVDRYQKTHLVPFGEYVPARDLLDWLPILEQVPRDAVPGDEPKVFMVGDVPVAVVLSYEGDFGSLVRSRIDAGGRLLIVATNTSTWRESWASIQHVAFSQVRAAENGVPVIHAAISGISAVIRDDGRISRALPLYEEGVIVGTVFVDRLITVYAEIGDWLLLGFILACAGVWEIGRRRSAQAVPSPDA